MYTQRAPDRVPLILTLLTTQRIVAQFIELTGNVSSKQQVAVSRLAAAPFSLN